MPFVKSERLPNEPIIVATYDGFITAQDVRDAAATIAEFASTIEGSVYVISDILTATSSFAEVLEILRDQSRGVEGTTTDPRIHVVLVGSNVMGKLFVDAMRQMKNGGVNVPMFPNMQAAFDSVRLMAQQYRQTA